MGEPMSTSQIPWRTVLHQAAGPVAITNQEGRFVYVNPALCRMLDCEAEDLLHRPPGQFTHPEDPRPDKESIARLLASPKNSIEVEKRFVRADGSVIWALVTSSIIQGGEDEPVFLLSQIHDITERKEAGLRWRRTVDHAPNGVALLDLEGRWTEVNDRLCEMVGYQREELLGRHFLDLTYPADCVEGMEALQGLLSGAQDVVTLEKRYRHKDGHPFWMLIRSSVVPGPDDRPAYLVSHYEAIGDGQMRNTHLAHMALHDPLTGLANRALLTDRLERGLAELFDQRHVLTLLMIDLDDLKPVNDTYGHSAGDRLLTTAADELLSTVRAGDTVARLGGDEFVVLARVEDFADAEALRERIVQALHTKVQVDGEVMELRASVGLAARRNARQSAEALLRRADRNMYRHKKGRKR